MSDMPFKLSADTVAAMLCRADQSRGDISALALAVSEAYVAIASLEAELAEERASKERWKAYALADSAFDRLPEGVDLPLGMIEAVNAAKRALVEHGDLEPRGESDAH